MRIFSMTKPVTGVALMSLYEEGKFRLSDPISRYIPEFKDLKVFAGTGPDGKPILEAPKHAPTMGELMSHTAGFTYGHSAPPRSTRCIRPQIHLARPNLQEFINKMAQLPLAYPPGEGWIYSVSVDIRVTSSRNCPVKPLGTLMRERIFNPLKMNDTGFCGARRTNWGDRDHLNRARAAARSNAARSEHQQRTRVAAGRRRSVFDGGRLLALPANGRERRRARRPAFACAESVELMRTNRVPDEVPYGQVRHRNYRQQPGLGFGLDFAILEDPLRLGQHRRCGFRICGMASPGPGFGSTRRTTSSSSA